MVIGDYTTQYIRDSNNPVEESQYTQQYTGMREGFCTLLNWENMMMRVMYAFDSCNDEIYGPCLLVEMQ